MIMLITQTFAMGENRTHDLYYSTQGQQATKFE